MKKLLSVAALPFFVAMSCVAQTTAKPAAAKTNAPAATAEPWTRIPIPPLHAFTPVEPKRIDLPNGLIIFLQEDHELPFVHGSILIRGGGRDEPADKVGMVSLYGSTWRTSGTKAESGDALDDKLAGKAASIETSGSFASTTLRWSSLKEDFDTTFASAMDLLLHPNFQQDKLELAKRRMEAGIARRNDEADAIAGREAMRLVYGKSSPYARNVEYATIEAVTLNDLRAWHERTVVPNGMIVSVSGDFDSAAMEAKLRTALGGLQRGASIAPLQLTYPGPKPGVYSVDKNDIDQSSILIVGMGTQRDNPDYYALSVMNEIFSGGFGSRIFQTVRTKLGLAYSVGGVYSAQYDHPGIFYVEAGTKSVSTVAATKAMLDVVKRLKTDSPTPEEMKKAKDDVLNSFIFSYDTPEKVLNEQVILAFYGYPADFLTKFKAAVEKVTAADVSRVANQYIDPAKLAIVVVGNGDEIKPKLDELGTVTPLDISIPPRDVALRRLRGGRSEELMADLAKSGFGVAIMAAGKGTRLNSKRPKVLHEVGGRALLAHVIAAATKIVPAERIYCIVGHEAARVQEATAASGVKFVLQAEQRGTGHALQILKAHFATADGIVPEHLLVLSGDVPLIREETLRTICKLHLKENAAMTILTAEPEDPTGYGRVIRVGNGPEVTAIIEQKALTKEQHVAAREINSGIYCFRTKALFAKLDSLSDKNAAGEFYLTDLASLLVADGERVVSVKADESGEVLGANTIAEMMQLDAAVRAATARRLMAEGVTIFRPETCVIDAEVRVGADTVIEPFVQLLGATRIGSECRIRSYSVIQDSVLGHRVLVRNGCILDHAQVGDSAVLGPYAHLRPESRIGAEAHIGNFVETKKVLVGKGSKANHLTYLGDATVGEGVNVGAGVITCNYDGVNKHTTVIGDGVFVGSGSQLVAPITVASGAYIAAGSCITEDVPEDALAIARSRQVNKTGWAKSKRASLKKQSGS